MGIFQRVIWPLKVIGILLVVCSIAGVFYIINSNNVLLSTSEVLADTFTHKSFKTNQAALRDTACDPMILDYSQISPLDLTNPNDRYIDRQWALKRINAPELWRVSGGNVNSVVAILDTGIDKYHEDLANVVIAEINFTDSTTVNDLNGHGTHIAGIISANSNNEKGIVGLAHGISIMNVKVADDAGQCQARDVAQGIIWAVDNGAEVINISLEFVEASEDVDCAIDYAWENGALVIAAAGNNGNDKPVYPASYENAVAVTAITMDDCLAPLANYGEWIDVAAPGMNIYSLLTGNNYGYKTGTSFATAHVSGLAAVLFNVARDINCNGFINDEVRGAIESSCEKSGILDVGVGCIDAAAALASIQ